MRDRLPNMDPTPENFRRYFGDRMTDRERNAFERMLEQDPFAAEAAEGYARLKPGDAEQDLSELGQRIQKREKRSRKWILYGSAAAVLSALIISTFFLKLEAPKDVSLSEELLSGESGIKEQLPVVEEDKQADSIQTVSAVQVERKGKGARVNIPDEVMPPVKEQEPAKRETIREENEVLKEELVISEEDAVELHFDLADAETPAPLQEKIAAPAAASRSKSADYDSGGLVETTTMEKKKEYPNREYKISGRVISAQDDEPLPGVAITEKNTLNGTVTDSNGYFQLSVNKKDEEPVLMAQFIGMDSEEVRVQAGDTSINIVMEPNLLALDEVVVVGYGVSSKEDETATAYPGIEEQAAYSPAEPLLGRNAFNAYISENMRFPDGFPDLSRAVVILKFSVDDSGRPVAIEIVKSPGKAFSEIAIALLENGPDWQQPMLGDEVIEQRQRLRLVFER